MFFELSDMAHGFNIITYDIQFSQFSGSDRVLILIDFVGARRYAKVKGE